MQWLIDLIIAWIYTNGIFRDRGPGLTSDFTTGDFIQDGDWHELDLSDIVDKNTKGVAIRLVATNTAVEAIIRLRGPPDYLTPARCCLRTQIAGVKINTCPVIPVSDDRKIEYQLTTVTWTYISLGIRGWWL